MRVNIFGRLSYPNLFEKSVNKKFPNNPPAYSCMLIFSKESVEKGKKLFDPAARNDEAWKKFCTDLIVTPSQLRTIAKQAAEKFFPVGCKTRPKDFENDKEFRLIPKNSADEPNYSDRPGYGPGTYFVGAKNEKLQPYLFDPRKQPVTEFTPALLYPGCFVIVQADIYPTGVAHGANRGVSLNLLAVTHIAEGERLGGSVGNIDEYPEIAMPDGFGVEPAGDGFDV